MTRTTKHDDCWPYLRFSWDCGPICSKCCHLDWLRHAMCSPWVQNLACVKDPTRHPETKFRPCEGAKRILVHKAVKEEPITGEILKALVDKYATEQATLADIHTLTISLYGFTGFSNMVR